MQIIKTVEQWRSWRSGNTHASKSIGFVPTMGALHKGHLSLVERSVKENQINVVSIFLNPTQFNNQSDLQAYPESFETDVAQLERTGVDQLLAPDFNEIYPDNYQYKVIETSLSKQLCGKHRPGHFDGVLSVVLRLLNLVQPDRAYFGEKDYQQYQLVKGMAEAFLLETEIVSCSTVREADGLAFSSRNFRLTPGDRELAPKFYEILSSRLDLEKAVSELVASGFKVDYVEDFKNRRFGAVYLGEVRLIDNVPC
ncbi:pantoate--beta-alanine ligase [bacterium]|nr:pantoate--beta-alanine ligase [bacterium]